MAFYKMKDIPSRNKSRFGWWVATLIERFEFEDEDTSDWERLCEAWSNVVVLKASCRDEAYQKAIIYAENSDALDGEWEDESGRVGRWTFAGISSLLPIYEDFDPNGTEILFDKLTKISVSDIMELIKSKERLEVFDDLSPVLQESSIALTRKR